MANVTVSEVLSMSVVDRIRLVQAIWDSIADGAEEIPLTASQRAVLDECYAEYLANPAEGSPWSEVKARLLSDK